MKSAPRVILASTSPYRRALLDRLGLVHTAISPRFEEVADASSTPKETALRFAEGKARSLADENPGALIIGSDQTLEIDGCSARKPCDRAELLAQLERLSGKSHELHAAVAVLDTRDGRLAREAATVRLTMRELGRHELERYIDLDEPFGCLGGYTFERRGVVLFTRVEGADDSAIVGLPLMSLARCFSELDFPLLDLLGPRDQSL